MVISSVWTQPKADLRTLLTDFETRPPATTDLTGNGTGVGRELFDVFRRNVGLASTGAAVVV